MDSVLSFMNEYRIILGAIVLTLIALLVVKKFWDTVSFFVLRMKMNAPVLGKINRLAKNPAREDSGWFHSEKDLCSEFRPFYQDVNKSAAFYENCKNYLRKVGELGRKNLGMFGWAIICVMVFIEAMGFSYVLAGFTIPGASESLQQQGAIGIALLISGLLVYLTHATGHELYKNTLLKKIRVWWQQSDADDRMEPNNKVTLANDEVDDNDPAWRNMLSRISTNAEAKPSYKLTVITSIFVILVAIGATYVRGQVLEQMLIEEHSVTDIGSAPSASADPYATEVPAELVADQQEVDATTSEQVQERKLKGGWATFIVLAVIFIFLQILGVVIGIKTGFAGEESGIAHKYSHKFKNREEFESYHERKRNLIAQVAQRNLTKLQALMAKKLSQTATNKQMLQTLESGNGRTFLQYTRKDSKDQGQHDIEQAQERKQRDSQIAKIQSSKPASTAPAAASEPVEADSESHGFSEKEIAKWQEKLGWDRARVIDLLVKQRQKKEVEKKQVSEEEALRMMEEESK
ncbi:hypothetical protein CF392_10635 [Tamilnaduibacter salinus]|uniref:Uncharacterized protein n=1 Tax=Tamilnaduibacter salinus TaxID=1484056 RepID=A0A2A2I1K1_9GAMM|nr:hypothetical protein [Tamilnaduibacter salinus]PAV25482.1 hypothetical protein CF392_10635 [Tamilnaduibacter salinus]